jgi:hypothetical protein
MTSTMTTTIVENTEGTLSDAVRSQVTALARKAGFWEPCIKEIENGCSLVRAYRIFCDNLEDCRPGTLVLSDVDAARMGRDILFAERVVFEDARQPTFL